MLDLISRERFEYIACKKLNYTLQDGEKDYFLALVMKIVSESELDKKLVFKGGMSIYHCYLDQYRFSEDLDLTPVDKDIDLVEIKEIFFERLS